MNICKYMYVYYITHTYNCDELDFSQYPLEPLLSLKTCSCFLQLNNTYTVASSKLRDSSHN